MNDITIPVKFTCTLCGVLDRVAHVLARPSEMELKVWMDTVFGPAMRDAHRKASPLCPAQSLSNVKIPITGADWVGGPPVQ